MNEQKCCESVWPAGVWRGQPCKNSAKVLRGGKPYCNIHDPERVKQKDAERTAKYKAQFKAISTERRLANAAPEMLIALETLHGWLSNPNISFTPMTVAMMSDTALRAIKLARGESVQSLA